MKILLFWQFSTLVGGEVQVEDNVVALAVGLGVGKVVVGVARLLDQARPLLRAQPACARHAPCDRVVQAPLHQQHNQHPPACA